VIRSAKSTHTPMYDLSRDTMVRTFFNNHHHQDMATYKI
jgi:hypothetical protein